MTEDNKPPLFTAKSLRIFTKGIVIYAVFYILTSIAQTIAQPIGDIPVARPNGYLPLYVIAAFHFVLGIINLAVVLLKKYNWIVPSISAVLIVLARIYFQELQLWIWSW